MSPPRTSAATEAAARKAERRRQDRAAEILRGAGWITVPPHRSDGIRSSVTPSDVHGVTDSVITWLSDVDLHVIGAQATREQVEAIMEVATTHMLYASAIKGWHENSDDENDGPTDSVHPS